MKTEAPQPTTHARLSPSSSSRWLSCPGSLIYPPSDTSSIYADEGSAAHHFAAMALEQNKQVEALIGETTIVNGEEWVLSPEMAMHVDTYVEYVRLIRGDAGELFIEVPLALEGVLTEPKAIGTSDAVVIREGVLNVCDLKYGRGEVEAHKNTQLIIYALGAMIHAKNNGYKNLNKIVMHIVQPRLAARQIKTFELTIDELREWFKNIHAKATQGYQIASGAVEPKVTDFTPSASACKWCPGAGVCPALHGAVNTLALKQQEPAALATDKLIEAYDAIPLVKLWIKAVEAAITSKLEKGDEVKGIKLGVTRVGLRCWSDGPEASESLRELFGDEAFNLITPAQAEKLARVKKIHKTDEWLALCSQKMTRKPDSIGLVREMEEENG